MLLIDQSIIKTLLLSIHFRCMMHQASFDELIKGFIPATGQLSRLLSRRFSNPPQLGFMRIPVGLRTESRAVELNVCGDIWIFGLSLSLGDCKTYHCVCVGRD